MRTQADRIEAELQAHPNEWVNMMRLHEVSGSMAVHSRIAELREQRGHLIENRVLKRRERGTGPKRTISLYRLVVKQEAKQGELKLA